MDISRRTFLKASVAGGAGLSALGFDLRPAYAAVRQLKIRNANTVEGEGGRPSARCPVRYVDSL